MLDYTRLLLLLLLLLLGFTAAYESYHTQLAVVTVIRGLTSPLLLLRQASPPLPLPVVLQLPAFHHRYSLLTDY